MGIKHAGLVRFRPNPWKWEEEVLVNHGKPVYVEVVLYLSTNRSWSRYAVTSLSRAKSINSRKKENSNYDLQSYIWDPNTGNFHWDSKGNGVSQTFQSLGSYTNTKGIAFETYEQVHIGKIVIDRERGDLQKIIRGAKIQSSVLTDGSLDPS